MAISASITSSPMGTDPLLGLLGFGIIAGV
jgi:hypothetical protein